MKDERNSTFSQIINKDPLRTFLSLSLHNSLCPMEWNSAYTWPHVIQIHGLLGFNISALNLPSMHSCTHYNSTLSLHLYIHKITGKAQTDT